MKAAGKQAILTNMEKKPIQVKVVLFWGFLLAVFYLATRFFHILSLPIFTDEAIYIRWAQIGGADASWRFISLTDGKQPLFTWAMMAALRLIHDPLLAGRVTSVAAGFFGMIGMYILASELFHNRRIGLFASFLYIICPFTLFYDRLALYDSLVAAFSVWNLYLIVLLIRTVRLDVALILGMMLGVGMLNKTSAFMSLYFMPVAILLFDMDKKEKGKRVTLLIWYILIAIILSQLIYSILRLSPYFYIIAQKDAIFVYPFSQWLLHPLEFFRGNIRGMFDWLIGYMSLPLLAASVISFGFGFRLWKEKVLLFLWWLLPFIALALFGRVLYPRHMLFMVLPLLILAASTGEEVYLRVKNRWIAGLILLFFISMIGYQTWTILADIKTAHIPQSERNQYIDDWPSGWGVSEIVTFLSGEAQKGNISVFTEGTFGLMPYAFEIYLGNNPRIDITGIWPIPDLMPQVMKEKARDHKTYYVMYQHTAPPFGWHLLHLRDFIKGANKNAVPMRLYEVLPE